MTLDEDIDLESGEYVPVGHICKFDLEQHKKHDFGVFLVRLLDVADLMESSLPDNASSDGIHFDTPKGTEWLNGVFQRHINLLGSDLLETAQFTLGPPPIPPFFAPRPLSSRLGARVDSRDSSRSSRADNQDPHRWKPRRQNHPRPRVRWCLR